MREICSDEVRETCSDEAREICSDEVREVCSDKAREINPARERESCRAASPRVCHEFGPVWDAHSRILILGSFPSVKSREQKFYYGHPQNRFWKVLAAVLEKDNVPDGLPGEERAVSGMTVPGTTEEKRAFLLRHGVALWDVIESCEIQGSSDSSIRAVKPNDIAGLLARTHITKIYVNGGKAAELYRRYVEPTTGRAAVRLPSTSPANAAWSVERLVQAWQVIRER